MAFIQVPPDSTGKKVETTSPDATSQRQVINVGSGTTTDLAPVDGTNGLAVDNKTLAPDAATETTLAALNTKVAEAVTADYDTGAGTEAVQMLGIALPASGGAVAGGTATNPVRVDPTGTTTQPVSAASLPLPSGAATAANQTTGNTSLSSIDGKITACNTGAVVVSSSALPSGAATSAKQPALGTAGTASADVLTVQGIASMTALKVDGSAVTQPVSGTFWQATQPVSLASVPSHSVTNAGTFAVQATLQAGTALAGQVSASPETSTVYNGTTALTPKFAAIAASSSGDNNLVSAVTSKKIRVLAYNFIANGTVNAKFRNDTTGTPSDLTGLKYCVANMGLVAPFNPAGWFETAAGKNLGVNLSAGVAIGGELVYIEV